MCCIGADWMHLSTGVIGADRRYIMVIGSLQPSDDATARADDHPGRQDDVPRRPDLTRTVYGASLSPRSGRRSRVRCSETSRRQAAIRA